MVKVKDVEGMVKKDGCIVPEIYVIERPTAVNSPYPVLAYIYINNFEYTLLCGCLLVHQTLVAKIKYNKRSWR